MNRMKSGVNIKLREMSLNKMPSPNSRINRPESMRLSSWTLERMEYVIAEIDVL